MKPECGSSHPACSRPGVGVAGLCCYFHERCGKALHLLAGQALTVYGSSDFSTSLCIAAGRER